MLRVDEGFVTRQTADGTPTVQAVTTYASDGKTFWRVFGSSDNRRYIRLLVAADGSDLALPSPPMTLPLIEGFFNAKTGFFARLDRARYLQSDHLEALRNAGRETWQGKPYRVVVAVIAHRDQIPIYTQETRLYIGDDSLIHRILTRFNPHHPNYSSIHAEEFTLDTFTLDAPMTPHELAYAPPPNAKDETPASTKPLPLANGTLAPDFTAEDKDGKPVKLSDFRGKIVLLDFWATWCGPCLRSMPHTNAVAKKLGTDKIVVLAVNVWDKPEDCRAWLARPNGYEAIRFVRDTHLDGVDIAKQYALRGIPTQYVVDRHGKVCAYLIGYDGPVPDLEAALHAAMRGR